MSEPGSTEAELERFRRQWKEEVSTRTKGEQSTTDRPQSVRRPSGTVAPRKAAKTQAPTTTSKLPEVTDDGEGHTFHDLPDKEEALQLGAAEKGLVRPVPSTEPVTALEHYEKAVENESAGKLGESLISYRKAFRLDDSVQKKYMSKHFPPSATASKPAQINPSNASSTVPNPAHHSLHGLPPTISELMEEFGALSIATAPPPTEASPAPPCPLAELPQEIISQILYHVGKTNIGAFSRLSLVCKKFAYLTMTEEQIWKAVTLSASQGFGSMHYTFTCDVFGKPLINDSERTLDPLAFPTTDDDEPPPPSPPMPSFTDISHHLLTTAYASSWRHMFRARPRIRFHGVYISTVNYTRPGAASATLNTWSTPVHVVTYYRYLRFHRDGTCISLLTTAEPPDVVHLLARDNLADPTADPRQTRRNAHLAAQSRPPPTSLDRAGAAHGKHPAAKADQQGPAHLPVGQIMKDALRGRWRLSGPGDGVDGGEGEGDLHVETEGVVPRYTYKMQFAVGAGAGADGTRKGGRAGRLAWKGFWSYNRLTDDWGEFGLRNDRAFYFSRVKSYGMGE